MTCTYMVLLIVFLKLKFVQVTLTMLVAELLLLIAAEFLLSSRDDDTRSWGNFLVYFSHKCHANLRGWGYIFIGC